MKTDKSICPRFGRITDRAKIHGYACTVLPGVLVEARKLASGEIEYRLNDVPCVAGYVKALILKEGYCDV